MKRESYDSKSSKKRSSEISERESNLKKVRDSYLFQANSLKIQDQEKDLNYDFQTPIQQIIIKFCDNSVEDYIFHTRIFLEYDEEDAFIFIFNNSLVFTRLFDENSKTTIPNPIIYIIKLQQIYYYDLHVNETDGNYIILQFYENDYVKKSEM